MSLWAMLRSEDNSQLMKRVGEDSVRAQLPLLVAPEGEGFKESLKEFPGCRH